MALRAFRICRRHTVQGARGHLQLKLRHMGANDCEALLERRDVTDRWQPHPLGAGASHRSAGGLFSEERGPSLNDAVGTALMRVWRPNKDKRLHLLCAEGAEAFEAVPRCCTGNGPMDRSLARPRPSANGAH